MKQVRQIDPHMQKQMDSEGYGASAVPQGPYSPLSAAGGNPSQPQQPQKQQPGGDDERQRQQQQEPDQAPKQPGREQKPEHQKQPQQGKPNAGEINGKWKQQISAAMQFWEKLTEEELLPLEGNKQKLAGLVQERYAVTSEEAEKQVKEFFQKNQC